MAFKPEDLPNSVAGDANYPGGSGQDEITPGVSNDGTPLEKNVYNDIQGLLQGLLSDESIIASGISDTVLLSDYKDGLGRFLARGGKIIDRADTTICVIGQINRPLNAGGAITLLLPTTGLYAYATVLFALDPPALYSINGVTFDAVVGTIGNTAQTVILTTDNLLGGFQRDSANTKWVPIKLRVSGTEL